jgi:TonB family protein
MNRAIVVLIILAFASCGPKQPPLSVSPADLAGSHESASSTSVDPPRQVPLRVGGDVVAPVLVKRVEPDASECTQTRIHLAGGPFVEALIDEAGVPKNVRIIKSVHPCIDRALVQAVEQWRFSPATLDGRPVPVIFHMTSRIHLK